MDSERTAYDPYAMEYDGAPMDAFYPQSAFVRQPVSGIRFCMIALTSPTS